VININKEIRLALENFHHACETRDVEQMEMKFWLLVIYVYQSGRPIKDIESLISSEAMVFKGINRQYYKESICGWGYDGTFKHALEQTLLNLSVADEEIVKIFHVLVEKSSEAVSFWFDFLKKDNEPRAKMVKETLFQDVKLKGDLN